MKSKETPRAGENSDSKDVLDLNPNSDSMVNKSIDEAIKQQWIWLNKLQNISNKPILIKMKEGRMPKGEGGDPDEYRWVPFKDTWRKVKSPIYTRTILTNEVCFDPDVKDWNVLKTEMQKVLDYCKANTVPVLFAYSGGNGIHGHLFLNPWEIDNEIIKKIKILDVDHTKIIRDTIMNMLLKDADASRQRLKIDAGKVTFDKGSKGSMIREFGTTRPDGGFKTLITTSTIPDTKEDARKLPLVFPAPDSIERWTPPENYIDEINKSLTATIEKAEKYSEFNLDEISLEGNDIEAFPCIKKLLKRGAESRY